MKKLFVLSRTYCHLCDDMIAALQLVQRRVLTQPELFHSFDISIVDIDQHSALESAWGDKVPVLLIANAVDDLKRDAAVEVGHAATNGAINNTKTEICHYFLDENALLASLSTTFQYPVPTPEPTPVPTS